MKYILIILSVFIIPGVNAQLKVKAKCDNFVVDVLGGKVNGLKPDFTNGQIKSKLPCYTSEQTESSTAKCGSAVFYKDRDIYFYTQRDYVEIGEKFKGKLTVPLLGAKRNSLFKWLGHPKLKDDNWEAFQTEYGCLVLHYNTAGKVRLIQFSTKSTDELNLCE